MGLISWILILSGLPALLLSILPVSDKLAANIAKAVCSLSFILSIYVLAGFDVQSAEFQFVEKANWIPELGISYEVGIDGISLFMLLLTNLSVLLILFSQTKMIATIHPHRIKGYSSLFLFLQFSLVGVFVSLDLILFFVFFELMLLPSFLLINGWGAPNSLKTGIRFVLYTATGSAFMLCSMIYLGWVSYNQSGNLTFSLIDLSQNVLLSPELQAWLFLGFFIAFAVKSPIVPFHYWLPETYTQAPSALTAFMSAVMAKAGLYGMIRFNWNLFPSAVDTGVDSIFDTGWFSDSYLSSFLAYAGGFQDFLIYILVAGVVYSALIAWSQRNIKTLIAYSSVSHLAVCVAAIIVCSSASISAAVFFMFAHGLASLGLFLLTDHIIKQTGSAEIVELGGLVNYLPRLSVLFFIFLLASIAIPLSGNFVAEFLVLLSLFSKYPVATAIAGLSVIFSAVYMLSMFRRAFLGNKTSHLSELRDIGPAEIFVFAPLAVLIFISGILPDFILSRIEPSAKKLEQVVFDANYRDTSNLNYDLTTNKNSSSLQHAEAITKISAQDKLLQIAAKEEI